MVAPDDQHAQPPRYKEADMVAAIARLEQQVSFNYNIIQGHRQEFRHINETVGRLQRDIEVVVAFMKRMRDDLRLGWFLPRAMDQSLYEPTDVKVLANPIANVTTKVNWVDNLETKIQLTKQHLKRLETQIANNAPGPLLSGAASRAEQQHYEAMRAQQKQQAPSHPMPTMRPGAALPFEHGHPPAPVLESRPTPGFHRGQERQLSASGQNQNLKQADGLLLISPKPPNALLMNISLSTTQTGTDCLRDQS
ncbi:hypothetical protein WHR41_09295 [Cladosporium halotolerans]|uniref:Uncharacterized protein n=1 Tax=Cladosporium halotolerans TaxID=1052096 RepID=A0AB34KD94_9PEZI